MTNEATILPYLRHINILIFFIQQSYLLLILIQNCHISHNLLSHSHLNI